MVSTVQRQPSHTRARRQPAYHGANPAWQNSLERHGAAIYHKVVKFQTLQTYRLTWWPDDFPLDGRSACCLVQLSSVRNAHVHTLAASQPALFQQVAAVDRLRPLHPLSRQHSTAIVLDTLAQTPAWRYRLHQVLATYWEMERAEQESQVSGTACVDQRLVGFQLIECLLLPLMVEEIETNGSTTASCVVGKHRTHCSILPVYGIATRVSGEQVPFINQLRARLI